jgi:hypothetical protein
VFGSPISSVVLFVDVHLEELSNRFLKHLRGIELCGFICCNKMQFLFYTDD